MSSHYLGTNYRTLCYNRKKMLSCEMCICTRTNKFMLNSKYNLTHHFKLGLKYVRFEIVCNHNFTDVVVVLHCFQFVKLPLNFYTYYKYIDAIDPPLSMKIMKYL